MTSPFQDLADAGVDAIPVYQPGSPIETVARELGFDDPSELDKLASNENALGPSPRAIDAMRAAAADMHRYPDGGTFYLREALGRHLDVAPECILPGNGSNELIELLGHAFLRPGVGLVMAETAFVVYRLVGALFGADVTTVPMRDFTHDLVAMRAAITPDTRLVFISNPNNPTGTMVTPEDIDAFMADLPPHAIVCFDEAYIELVDPSARADVLRYVRDNRRVVVLRTFSKAYGLAGLRLGYAVAPPACIALLQHVRQPFNVNAMAQAAAVAALGDHAHVAATRRLLESEIPYLYAEFDRLGLDYVPATANFVLLKVGAGQRIQAVLKRRGSIVRPMAGYGLPEYVRVTVGTHAENERFVSSLEACLRDDGRVPQSTGGSG